jgi:homopolymeric O-antigen transport system ATP-binding protein
LMLAQLISRAAAVVGQSYHLAITALVFGVPVFASFDVSKGKYTALSGFESLYSMPTEEENPDRFISRLGKAAPSANAIGAREMLSKHWDRVAEIIRERSRASQTDGSLALDRFWQALPGLLEPASRSGQLESRIADIYNSPSWRITAPLRSVMRGLKRLAGK